MMQTDRSTQISETLKNISLQSPADIGASLKAYIAELDAKQQTAAKASIWDLENPPVWSHERAMQRSNHHEERARLRWRQENKYQQEKTKYPLV